MKMEKGMKGLIAAMLLVVALVSFVSLGKAMTTPTTYHHTIESLEKKEQDVLMLTAGATATSVIITLIPDDIGTPLADKLADVAGYLLIVICAVYAEKYLLTITGFLAFKILIPLACIFLIISLYRRREFWRPLAIKAGILALAASVVIPLSIRTSEMVEGVYRESIEETIEEANQAQDEVGSKEALMERAKAIINHYIQAVAIFIVTSCVIPVLVLLFFCWIIRLIFGINIQINPIPIPRRHRESDVE